MNLECPKCYGRIPYEGDDPLVLIDSGEVLVCPDCRQRWMFVRHPKREGEEIGMPLIKEAPQDKRLQTFILNNLYSKKFLQRNSFKVINGELVSKACKNCGERGKVSFVDGMGSWSCRCASIYNVPIYYEQKNIKLPPIKSIRR